MTGWLPSRGLLLHIGPHKTGTTAIQGALQAARPALARRGIVYPGSGRQHRMPALAVTNSRGVSGMRNARMLEWHRLCREVHAARRKRVVVSSESFVEADDATARRIVEDLGPQRVHVVVTLRPLAKILPSAWQQLVRNQLTAGYDEWLDAVLNHPADRSSTRNFWHRHRHEWVVERWGSIVGRDRVAVVVVDDADRTVLPRSFEQLLGLPEGFLVATDVRDNRGLTRPETELVRELNIEFDKRGWPDSLYNHVVREGVVVQMQSRPPDPGEPRIATPTWAVELANRIARESATRIRDLGVVVLGDLDTLGGVAPEPDNEGDELPAPAVSKALTGVRWQLDALRDPKPAEGNARPVDMIDTAELATIIGQRVSRRIRARLGLGLRRY